MVGPEPEGNDFAIMPSSLRLSPTSILTLVRHRQWIESYRTADNGATWAHVVRAVPDARFVICGDGELRPTLEEQIKRKHLERHVFLAGFRPESVILGEALTPGLGSFEASLTSSMFLGDAYLHKLTAAGLPILAKTAEPLAAVDDQVTLSVRPDSLFVFAHESAARE